MKSIYTLSLLLFISIFAQAGGNNILDKELNFKGFSYPDQDIKSNNKNITKVVEKQDMQSQLLDQQNEIQQINSKFKLSKSNQKINSIKKITENKTQKLVNTKNDTSTQKLVNTKNDTSTQKLVNTKNDTNTQKLVNKKINKDNNKKIQQVSKTDKKNNKPNDEFLSTIFSASYFEVSATEVFNNILGKNSGWKLKNISKESFDDIEITVVFNEKKREDILYAIVDKMDLKSVLYPKLKLVVISKKLN